MSPKSERFEMRVDVDDLERLDAWRGRQDDVPSRAEAVRRLMELGLSFSSSDAVKFSSGDKLILSMLGDLYKHLKVEGEIDPDFVGDAIGGGHFWGLRWKYPGIYHDHEDNPQVVTEVLDVLDMWSFLEEAYADYSKKDKERIAKDVPHFGKDVRFPGFDGNNESEYLSVARFLIDRLERFSRFKGRELNSHSPSIDVYRRMYKVFEPARATLTGGGLNVTQSIAILNERVHPSYRTP